MEPNIEHSEEPTAEQTMSEVVKHEMATRESQKANASDRIITEVAQTVGKFTGEMIMVVVGFSAVMLINFLVLQLLPLLGLGLAGSAILFCCLQFPIGIALRELTKDRGGSGLIVGVSLAIAMILLICAAVLLFSSICGGISKI